MHFDSFLISPPLKLHTQRTMDYSVDHSSALLHLQIGISKSHTYTKAIATAHRNCIERVKSIVLTHLLQRARMVYAVCVCANKKHFPFLHVRTTVTHSNLYVNNAFAYASPVNMQFLYTHIHYGCMQLYAILLDA